MSNGADKVRISKNVRKKITSVMECAMQTFWGNNFWQTTPSSPLTKYIFFYKMIVCYKNWRKKKAESQTHPALIHRMKILPISRNVHMINHHFIHSPLVFIIDCHFHTIVFCKILFNLQTKVEMNKDCHIS